MTIKISATELRKKLFSLLNRIERDPSTIVRIMKHDQVVGELSSPQLTKKGGAAAKALLKMANKFKQIKMPQHLSQQYKLHLYGLKK